MSLKHGILGLLCAGSMTGYDLSKSFSRSLNLFWQAQTSQIYRELRNMEKLGWIDSLVVIQTDKPNKNVFSITDAGKEELHRWLLEDSLRDDIQLRIPFLMKIFLCGQLSPDECIAKMQELKEICKSELAKMHSLHDITAVTAKQHPYVYYHGVTLNFGIHFYEMCISWADETIEGLINQR